MVVCNRCLLNSSIPTVTFDDIGICNYCHLHEKWEREHKSEDLQKIINTVKTCKNPNAKYDCIVGISGGCDSSYLLHKVVVDFGLKPLAVHWNNHWNTEIAEANMKKMVEGLNIDFEIYTCDQKEYDELCRAFLLASVCDADIPNDIALTTVLYQATEKHDCGFIMAGHNFRTEGTTPLEWSYMDGKYIIDVNKKFGRVPLKTFPNLTLSLWLRWLVLKQIKRIRPLWYLPYNKNEAKQLLHDKYGWNDYGGAHQENKYTKFISNYVQPKKFGIDLRIIFLSAQVRSGLITKDQAQEQLFIISEVEWEILEEVKQRLGFTNDEFKQVMEQPIKIHQQYRTYQPFFKRNKWFFKLMVEYDLVPKTFYEKYTR